MRKKVILADSERTVMELLWEKQPQTMMELYHSLSENPGWSKSTVNTMLSRMLDKKIIKYTQGEKAKLYRAAVKKTDADMAETDSLIDRIYDGSVSLMMSTLVRQKKMSADEIDELKKILNDM